MQLNNPVYVTPHDLWPGARYEDAQAVVGELRKHDLPCFSAPTVERRQLGIGELVKVVDAFRLVQPALLDERIIAAEEAGEAARLASLRQAKEQLRRRQEELEAAQSAVTEAAERLAVLEGRRPC